MSDEELSPNKRNLSSYNKISILKSLKERNASGYDKTKLFGRFRSKSKAKLYLDNVIGYINDSASKQQQKCAAFLTKEKNFINSNNLVQYLDAKGCRQSSTHDIALALKTISEAEDHPEPAEIQGIDLKALYATLSNLAIGYPVEELDEPTKEFLRDAYGEFMSIVSSGTFESDREILSDIIQENNGHLEATNRCADRDSKRQIKLVDTNRVDNFPKFIEESISDPILNPLSVPLSMLTNKSGCLE